MEIKEVDIKKIKTMSQNHHIYDTLLKSISPKVKGMSDIKEAILLALFMGSNKHPYDEVNIKQGINILIITDPNLGTERHFKSIDELAIKNKFKIIPDIKNMEESNLLNILNSDNSVFAVGTPKYGRFDKYKLLTEQIDLSMQILYCFDLIFLLQDKPNLHFDSKMADNIFEQNTGYRNNPIISNELFKKYLAYSYVFYNPTFTNEAMNMLKEFYVKLRDNNSEYPSSIPINARHLQSLIRLAEATAKIKLKESVEKDDAETAIRLQMSNFKDLGVTFEIGEIDVNIINGGAQGSNRNNIQRVTDEIKLLEEEFAGNAPVNVLISNMLEKYDVNESKTMLILKNLKQKGDIYSPAKGYWRMI